MRVGTVSDRQDTECHLIDYPNMKGYMGRVCVGGGRPGVSRQQGEFYPWGEGGGGGVTASLRVGTENKTMGSRFCATTAHSHCPCWFTAPCFQGIKGQPIVITIVTTTCPQWTSFSVVLIQLLL